MWRAKMSYENSYRKCEHCGQFINVLCTDHVEAEHYDARVYLHINPCWRLYSEVHDLTDEHIIRRHLHRS